MNRTPEQIELGFDSADGEQEKTAFNDVLGDTHQLFDLLERWTELGWLRSLDLALVRFLDEETRAAEQPALPLLLLGIALASHQLGRGHVCLDLNAMVGEGFNDALSLPPEDETAPDNSLLPSDILKNTHLDDWGEALSHPLLVSDGTDKMGQQVSDTPLVKDGLRLYLRRYWHYEQSIFQQLGLRLNRPQAMGDSTTPAALALKQALAALFPGCDPSGNTDWQRVACANAARHSFSVITGGPGTGKTTTVVRLLAALQSVALSSGDSKRPLRIRLGAPTGKAAARLNESIAREVQKLDLAGLGDAEQIREAIPTEVTTLHRLLGSVPGSRRFRHNANNPLVLDTLVIDEASMVDIEMMATLLAALPANARLVLLGDKDQLASVDAGAVLGELCQRASDGYYSENTCHWLEAVTGDRIDPALVRPDPQPLDQAITLLRKSYRFDRDSGIGRLAHAVNNGAGSGEVRSLFCQGYADIARLSLTRAERDRLISQHCVRGGAAHFPDHGRGRFSAGEPVAPPVGFGAYLDRMASRRPEPSAALAEFDRWADDLLKAYGSFQLLTALRRGALGVEGLNQTVATALHRAGLIRATEGWYPGRPVLITRNDYSLGLMNGDVGLTLELPARHWVDGVEVVEPERLVQRVAFAAGDGSGAVRWVLPSRLQSVETVYAMTVHKSQGSEFNHACLVLPDRLNPVLTRELIYTGITRARHWFSLLTPEEGLFEEAISRRVVRTSGLGRAMGVSGNR
ncbi:MAG: exodeoxyribonuclease V subunit alpha [Oleiphilaceae bacterium]|nr:exodeoxyribonuclease V subunit alpha [Oleiphilaceae bacterium]